MDSPLAALRLSRVTESAPLVVRTFDRLLAASKEVLHQRFFDANVVFFRRAGVYGLVYAAGLGFLFTGTVAVKADALRPLLVGLAWILAAFLALYIAEQFSGSGKQLLEGTPSQLGSLAFLNCFALLNLVGGCLALLGGAFLAINEESLSHLWAGLGTFVLCEYLATIAMSPGLANVTIRPRNSAGEEALGILSFLLKALLRLVPIAFGAGVVIGALAMSFEYVGFLTGDSTPSTALAEAYRSADLILTSAMLPMAGYVAFLLLHLVVNVVRSILSIPTKLDELRAASKTSGASPSVAGD
jgi:hypothetical protein